MSAITVLAAVSYLLHSANAAPLEARRVCYENCSQFSSKTKVVIVAVFASLVFCIIIMSYVLNGRRHSQARPWLRPLQAQPSVAPSQHIVSLAHKPESGKDNLRPYSLSSASGSTLAIPPPAYMAAPAYRS